MGRSYRWMRVLQASEIVQLRTGYCFSKKSTAFQMPCTTFSNASSWSLQEVTGLASFGNTWSLLKGVSCQSHGFMMIGMTRAVPVAWRSSDRCISLSKQYSEAIKRGVISSRITPADSSRALISASHSVPASISRSCQGLILPWQVRFAR